MPVEQEIKLSFESVEAARQAVEHAGGRLRRSRRLIDDRLFDGETSELRARGSALRIRRDGDRTILTWKGPATRGPVKSREELETGVEDPLVLVSILEALGYRQRFRAQKYRAEYELAQALVTIDETPIGVFVEIEGTPDTIASVSAGLGRDPSAYILESYPALWGQWCARSDRPFGDMLFEP